MIQCFEHALTTEPVETPEQHQIELPLASIFKHPSELWAIRRLAGSAIDVFVHDYRSGALAELAQLD
jgi:hypothetical protein